MPQALPYKMVRQVPQQTLHGEFSLTPQHLFPVCHTLQIIHMALVKEEILLSKVLMFLSFPTLIPRIQGKYNLSMHSASLDYLLQ